MTLSPFPAIAPRPVKRAIPTYADGFIGIRRHRGLWHRFCIRVAR